MTQTDRNPRFRVQDDASNTKPKLENFHLFRFLPYDLRHTIYILATPPRVVRVEEGPVNPKEKRAWIDQDYESYFDYAFENFYKEKLVKMPVPKLHPDLAAFAHNWRHRIPWDSYNRQYKQTCLETYGFTSNSPVYEPWQPSEETPRIPTDWLVDFPELAFELTRKCALYSDAEIPVFLHVCSESRQALVNWGYRLFFATRTTSPRIWFHPERDRLYIPHTVETFPRAYDRYYGSGLPGEAHTPYPCPEYSLLLSGCHWDIGQYRVDDLKKVRNVILESPSTGKDQDALIRELQSLLPLLSGLNELLLENWGLEEFGDWFYPFRGSHTVEVKTPASSVACIPVEDIDAIGYAFWERSRANDDNRLGPLCYTGYRNSDFNEFLENPSRSQSYHVAHAEAVKTELLEWKSDLATSKKPRIPTICHVNICPDSFSKVYLANRHRFWKALESLDHMQVQDLDFREKFSLRMSNCPPPFRIHWRQLDWDRDWPDTVEIARLTDAMGIDWYTEGTLQAWYLTRFEVPEPQCIEL
ncbi:uncharacterized protein FFUJ_06406 [Fusarium fujikuroi IMI 58289]|uniref:2EXR domain-containing protein n=2 Tax=Fusarium fujikuroi TaxID=5127 RepID=S0EDG3_GIBF5|nr:uncharacterized protein FFUJ_06406 [Fusarium fujikuroi IMI 58289]KLP11466.1 uncharacterized protein Y057_10029 [Fusarium fujikuroi]KLP14386.1 uncharacterized protein LW94_2978 [Fusarium fujikuroi]CCT70433.1 uncharacterized protein FFUJ_06406 [Fusarium fujikuroi IMI 58289]SCN84035.1 uncharacterized protein FFM5_03195 [Fusarium fujikuroi]SCN85651.1 uncharacterized protein FFC1_04939 [Fusarium fujikuroi]